ncbi:PREDICTED: trafficking kinesin-binding protein 2 [Hipposideros armiger]|uniref:Trafficking kinesin-binding protein 2 n=1 Tax=Hipposideros armiger TaxID=186990 RepID=A0A8B7QSD7_HIPAR|nr:PREDICTED: trafficking kinesin-binding protein 2 [Hipposideros armiger]
MNQSQNAIFTSPAGEENLMNSNHRNSESITDVCSNEDLPEAELVSLLEEQLPQYRLRVDSLFLYENQDWTRSPHQQQHASDALSPVLAEETFRYMILGTDRVEQMTKTYNDIDMVTHLLAERDRDLELAARIGQALLKRNHALSEQNEALEEQLGLAFDQVNQLQHELSKKDELLRIVSIASEESETDSSCSTPLRLNESFSLSQGLLQLDMLQEKLKELEEENLVLRSKSSLPKFHLLRGSQTLHHWQQLAQPNLGTILDPRPGVITKGFTQLPKDTIYHLSDLEEDEEEGITFQVQQPLQVEQKPTDSKPVTGISLPPITSAGGPVTVATSNPGKCLSCTNLTFTFTTCRILHPSDITQVTPSSGFPLLSCGSNGSSSSNMAVNSPAMSYRLSTGESITNRRDSTVTFSSTMSLAKLLQEQGISAKVYHGPVSESPLLQPLPKTLSIPSTPPNSPSHSPCPSPLPVEPRVHLSENFLASRPAETFLQERYGLRPSRNPPDVGQLKMNLVDRLKRLGIARVIKTPDAQEDGRSHGAETGLQRPESAVYLNSGSNLLSGLRRNQSLPIMMGSFGTSVCVPSPKMDVLKED